MGRIHGAAREAGRRIEKRTGCGFLPEVVQFMGKELEREISGKAQEFYAYVLPPTDMKKVEDTITVSIDLPGFKKEDIKVKLDGNVLQVSARREAAGADGTIYRQRPDRIEKSIALPARIKRGEEPPCPASLQDGVLVLAIPVPQSGRDIAIE